MFGVSLGRGPRPLRIAYGRLFHEANAWSPVLTELCDFERLHHMAGSELEAATTLRGTELKSFMPHAELTGFRQAARLAGDVETVPLQSSLAVPGGPLSRACFDGLVEGLVERIREALPLDGVYLALHGSMQVDGLEEAPEAHLLARVRELVGPDVKLAVSYDLHANLSEGLVAPVDVLVAYRTNPHWDLAPTGFRAGNRLIRALRGQIRPTHAWRKLPIVIGGGKTIDFLAPMRGVFKYLRDLENDPRVVSASLFMVHPYTNAEHLGWAVHVCTDGDPALADKLADELADRAWEERDVALPPMYGVDEGLRRASESRLRKLGPVTLVDCDDVVGAGAPGGNTRFVEALVGRGRDWGLEAFVPVHDPELVEQLWDAPLGERRAVTLRGTPGYGAPPVELDVVVAARATTDSGRTLRLDARAPGAASAQVHVVVCDRAPLPIHPSFWSLVGLSARSADVIVQKNFFHYRMFYATISFEHLPVISAGATSFDAVRAAEYVVPMVPAARLADWRASDPVLRRRKRAAVTGPSPLPSPSPVVEA
ncbi:MAG: M81 family metallopeptidase [Myxococcales bacterium]|jgi:microcystin degradation protein MlrC|nr:M81 family metallopeptidase [Myxococcales bacterium]MBL0198207.1 M81 family metallopeptidase [Myxococcales bacterium]